MKADDPKGSGRGHVLAGRDGYCLGGSAYVGAMRQSYLYFYKMVPVSS